MGGLRGFIGEGERRRSNGLSCCENPLGVDGSAMMSGVGTERGHVVRKRKGERCPERGRGADY